MHTAGRKLIANAVWVMLAAWDHRFGKPFSEVPLQLLELLCDGPEEESDFRKAFAKGPWECHHVNWDFNAF